MRSRRRSERLLQPAGPERPNPVRCATVDSSSPRGLVPSHESQRPCLCTTVVTNFPAFDALPMTPFRDAPFARIPLIAASILALGLVLAGVAGGAFFYAAQAPRGEVRVV